jgi:hypothetical protein
VWTVKQHFAKHSYYTAVPVTAGHLILLLLLQVEALQRELLAIDYKGLLHEDLMEHEVRSSWPVGIMLNFQMLFCHFVIWISRCG